MDRVKPQYAIPFASNHCYLHDDVFQFNEYICNPHELKQYVADHAKDRGWELQIMSPGSWWTSESGFELGDDSSFDNLEKSLAVYKQDVSGSLDRTRTDENRARITDAVLRRFGEMISYSPVGKSAGSVRISITWPDGREAGWRFALRDGSYATVETPEAPGKTKAEQASLTAITDPG